MFKISVFIVKETIEGLAFKKRKTAHAYYLCLNKLNLSVATCIRTLARSKLRMSALNQQESVSQKANILKQIL